MSSSEAGRPAVARYSSYLRILLAHKRGRSFILTSEARVRSAYLIRYSRSRKCPDWRIPESPTEY
ncbi:hypothetical protein RSAG8_03619, partial [Rhizoctonia solani AG-8 WAC10335]